MAMENKRQIIHISMAAFALLLAFLTRGQALACAVAAFTFNWLAMPRIGRGALRAEEKQKGYSTGMLMYCVSVFLLILIFPAHIAAGAWAVMAFGDGFASLIGNRFGNTKLPWNPNKSWAGFVAFIVAATAGCSAILIYTNHFHTMLFFDHWIASALCISLIASLSAATIESLDIRLNDNFSVPLTAGLALWILQFTALGNALPWFPLRVLPALAVSAAIGAVSYASRSIDKWGLAGGCAMGFLTYYLLDFHGFAILLLFFVLGTLFTRVGKKVKEKRGVAQEHKGRRGLRNVLANGGAGLLFAYVAGAQFPQSTLSQGSVHFFASIGFAGAFAAALSDTLSSEIGQLSTQTPVLITTLKPVPTGTNGGVTVTGTLAALCGAAAVGLCALGLGLVDIRYVWAPIAAGVAGSMVDSLLGASAENKLLLNNDTVNFACTLFGGLAAVLMALAFFSWTLTWNLLRFW